MTLIPLKDACELFATNPPYHRVYGWATDGIGAANGQRIRLQVEREGGSIYTTPEWVKEFREACNARLDRDPQDRITGPDKAAVRRTDKWVKDKLSGRKFAKG